MSGYLEYPSVMCKGVAPRVQTAPVFRDIKNLVHAKWEKLSSEERYNEVEDINSKQEEVRCLKRAASQDRVFTLTYDPGSTLGSWQLRLYWEGSCHQNPNKPGTWWKCWASFQTSDLQTARCRHLSAANHKPKCLGSFPVVGSHYICSHNKVSGSYFQDLSVSVTAFTWMCKVD